MAISSDQIWLITQSKGSILITAYKINWFEDGGPRLDTLKLLKFSGVLLFWQHKTTCIHGKPAAATQQTAVTNAMTSSESKLACKLRDGWWWTVKIQIGVGRPNKVKQHIRFHVQICTAGEFQVRHLQLRDDIEIHNTKPEVNFMACLINTVLQTVYFLYHLSVVWRIVLFIIFLLLCCYTEWEDETWSCFITCLINRAQNNGIKLTFLFLLIHCLAHWYSTHPSFWTLNHTLHVLY